MNPNVFFFFCKMTKRQFLFKYAFHFISVKYFELNYPFIIKTFQRTNIEQINRVKRHNAKTSNLDNCLCMKYVPLASPEKSHFWYMKIQSKQFTFLSLPPPEDGLSKYMIMSFIFNSTNLKTLVRFTYKMPFFTF